MSSNVNPFTDEASERIQDYHSASNDQSNSVAKSSSQPTNENITIDHDLETYQTNNEYHDIQDSQNHTTIERQETHIDKDSFHQSKEIIDSTTFFDSQSINQNSYGNVQNREIVQYDSNPSTTQYDNFNDNDKCTYTPYYHEDEIYQNPFEDYEEETQEYDSGDEDGGNDDYVDDGYDDYDDDGNDDGGYDDYDDGCYDDDGDDDYDDD